MIEIKNLSKSYGKQTVLSDMNWIFPDSGLVCLLGASGCGKSTLFNIIAGFDSEYNGEVFICGSPINDMNATTLCEYRKDNVGFVFQNYNLLKGYSVLDNLLLACEVNNNDVLLNTINATTLLEKLNIPQKIHEKAENLSGGQKQRVAIARALINNPSIILADEPTGALDRKNSTEIMELLKEISKDRLVLVITHDPKICEFADSIISLSNGKIVGENVINLSNTPKQLQVNNTVKIPTFKRGLKNFTVHLKRYIAVAIAISIGVLAFMLSLSFGNVMGDSITQFKEKNTAFNNGYIKAVDNTDKILEILKSDNRIENIYKQYILKNVTLSINGKIKTMAEKYPMPKATESMSYGIMPKINQNQIALSPSLAKKFDNDIKSLIGKELKVNYDKFEYKLIVSGICNASYDDFFVSCDIEKNFYKDINKENLYSVSYDVKDFNDIVAVNQTLINQNIKTNTAANEVDALLSTFTSLNRLFLIISILILIIGIFISIILLVKLQNTRFKEIGLLFALGFYKKDVLSIIVNENILLSMMTTFFNAIFIGISYLISIVLNLSLIITIPQIALSILGTLIIVITISITASYKLITTKPAVALRK